MYDLNDVTIRSTSVGTMDNNVYLLTGKSSGVQVLIDAADDAGAIQELVGSAQQDCTATTKLALVITTHSHWDHVRALGEIVAWSGTKTAAGAADVKAITVPTDVVLDDGDTGEFSDFSLTAIALRGHTPGSIALLYRGDTGPAHLFTGDSLFPGGLGNTQSDSTRFDQLFNDVVSRVFDVLPDDTVVHPGHGAGTTLGAERPHLGAWKVRGW